MRRLSDGEKPVPPPSLLGLVPVRTEKQHKRSHSSRKRSSVVVVVVDRQQVDSSDGLHLDRRTTRSGVGVGTTIQQAREKERNEAWRMKEGGLTDGGGAPSDAFAASAAVEASSSTSQRRLNRSVRPRCRRARPSVRPWRSPSYTCPPPPPSTRERTDGGARRWRRRRANKLAPPQQNEREIVFVEEKALRRRSGRETEREGGT